MSQPTVGIVCRRAGGQRPGALQSGTRCLLKGWLDMLHGGHVKRSCRSRGRLEHPQVAKMAAGSR